jgi:hypothetical protein
MMPVSACDAQMRLANEKPFSPGRFMSILPSFLDALGFAPKTKKYEVRRSEFLVITYLSNSNVV